jgi:hypothetical protein
MNIQRPSGRTSPVHLVLIGVLLGALGFLALVWRDAGDVVPGLPPRPQKQAATSTAILPALSMPTERTAGPVVIYLANQNLGSGQDCTKVFPLARAVPTGTDSLHGALAALIIGPTAAEANQGYGSVLPRQLTVNRLDQLNGTVFVDFGPELAKLAGSCAVQLARAEIERTLSTASASSTVVISIGGNAAEALQP